MPNELQPLIIQGPPPKEGGIGSGPWGVVTVGGITAETADQFSRMLLSYGSELRKYPGSRVKVLINSGGGAVGAGFAMLETMYRVKREFCVPVDTVITGYAYSMAATLVQGGDWRSMGYFSTVMFHSSSWEISGQDRTVFEDYRRLAGLYQQMQGELLHRRTGFHSAAWWRRFIFSGKERFLSARECLTLGLVDEACEFDECYLLQSTAEAAVRPLSGGHPEGGADVVRPG